MGQYLRFDKSMILLLITGGMIEITVLPRFVNPEVWIWGGLLVKPPAEFLITFKLVKGLKGFLRSVIPAELMGLMIWDRRTWFWGLILIKEAADLGLGLRIFVRSTSHASLSSIREAGLFKLVVIILVVLLRLSKLLRPMMSLFFKGLAKSEELVDRMILGSGSSSGMFKRFLPTAKSEFLWRFCGRQLMASFERLSVKKEREIVKMVTFVHKFFWNNGRNTVWKILIFPATQILREIFCHL